MCVENEDPHHLFSMDNIKSVPMATQTFFRIDDQEYRENFIPEDVVNPFDEDNWCSGGQIPQDEDVVTKNCTINESRLPARPVEIHLHPSRDQQWDDARTYASGHTRTGGATPGDIPLLRGYCWDQNHEYLVPMPPLTDIFDMNVFNTLRNTYEIELVDYSAMEIDHWLRRNNNGEDLPVPEGLGNLPVPDVLVGTNGLIRRNDAGQPIINERYFGETWEDPIHVFIPGCVKQERQLFPQQRTPVNNEAERAGYAVGSHTILVKHGENQFRKTMDNIVHAVCPSGNDDNLDELRRKAVNILYDNTSDKNTVVSSQPFHGLLPTRSGEGIDIPENGENYGTRYRGFLYRGQEENEEGQTNRTFVVSPNDTFTTVRERLIPGEEEKLFYPPIRQQVVKRNTLGDESLLVDDMALQGTIFVPASVEEEEEEEEENQTGSSSV
jgi:hypothetical protein